MAVKKFISKSKRRRLYTRDRLVCCYCEKQCVLYTAEVWQTTPKDVATLDHITSQWAIAQTCESDAEFRRAIADPKNLVVVCNGCNAHKQNTELYIWATNKGLDYAGIIARIADRIATSI